MVPQNTHPLWKGLPPCDHQKSYISVKGQKLCIFSSQNTKFSYTRGIHPLAIPARGPAPWTPVNASCKRLVCSLCSQLFEFPNVENLPKPMMDHPSSFLEARPYPDQAWVVPPGLVTTLFCKYNRKAEFT